MKWVHDGNGEVTTEEYEVGGQKVVDLICNCEVVNGVSVNADLIAAAPDLLKELQRLRDYVINICGVDDGDCDAEHPLMSSMTAISKALGEE